MPNHSPFYQVIIYWNGRVVIAVASTYIYLQLFCKNRVKLAFDHFPSLYISIPLPVYPRRTNSFISVSLNNVYAFHSKEPKSNDDLKLQHPFCNVEVINHHYHFIFQRWVKNSGDPDFVSISSSSYLVHTQLKVCYFREVLVAGSRN